MNPITVTDFSVGVRHYQAPGNAYQASGFFINQKNSLVHLQTPNQVENNRVTKSGASYNE